MSKEMIYLDDALAACDIAPPDEWNDYTKGGYDFAAEECKRNIAALPAVDPTDRIEELEKACTEWTEVSQSNYQRAKAAEAKLAKAVKALEEIKRYSPCGDSRRKAIETLAEIKGGKNVKSDL